jgi:hypothetical protein
MEDRRAQEAPGLGLRMAKDMRGNEVLFLAMATVELV